MIKLCQQDVRH